MQEIEQLPEGAVDALSRAGAFPGDESAREGVEAAQTHISHLFFTRDRVYKLRKPVVLPFLSFGSRAERNSDCLRELLLNRRLAPDVYLGIAPLVAAGPAGWQLGELSDELSSSPASEHCVVMRRLPEGRDALSLLEARQLTPGHVEAVAEQLARFHADHGLGVPAPWDPEAWLERVRAPVAQTLELLRSSQVAGFEAGDLDRCERRLDALFEARRARFEGRRRAGRVVDGHGDLHLDHVWFEPGRREPIVIDCVEFDAELRRIDVAAELAFFAMDLRYRLRSDLAEHFLARYAVRTDDFELYGVVDYHILHRALVRAAVAAVAAGQDEVDAGQRQRAAESATRHLQLVDDFLSDLPSAGLVLVCGGVGTGKSTAADVAAEALSGVVVSSDRTRKRMAGIEPETRAGARPEAGIYTPARTREVYRALLERAEPVVESGRVVILDATFSREEWRELARRWAEVHEVPILLLEVRCSEALVLKRLAEREREAGHVSDAGPDLFAWSQANFEPPTRWDPAIRRVVQTDRDDWQDLLKADLADWLRATGSSERSAR
jgi:aminoglycoside phosphotransferase family enzyme/predicted kinase